MSQRQLAVSTRTPAPWMNSALMVLLRTPGLQRLAGRGVALLTVTGRRSGRRYTLPVTYRQQSDAVVIVTNRARKWWRNLEERPVVEVRLAGRTLTGLAEVGVDDPGTASRARRVLRESSFRGEVLGATLRPDGTLDEADARALLPHVVVVRVVLD